MPNNYTVGDYLENEAVGDTPSNNTFPSSVQLVITPSTGYAIQASDFSLGTSGTFGLALIPPSFASYAFNDTVSALDPNNNVTLDVQIKSNFVFQAGPNSQYGGTPFNDAFSALDIDGNAHLLTSAINFQVSFFTPPANVNVIHVNP
jgi:hypothetical protein